MKRLTEWWHALQAWLRANKAAHERAQMKGCCSSPPPGSGHLDSCKSLK